MTISPELLGAYADGELDDMTAARVRRAVEQDPVLARQLEMLLSLKATVAANYDAVVDQQVPDRLTAPIESAAKVVDLGAARASRKRWYRNPLLRYAGGAIAAVLALALFINIGGRSGGSADVIAPQLAKALESRASGQATADGTKVLLSFRDRSGSLCRGYSTATGSGIACKDDGGWKIRLTGGQQPGSGADYQQAGSADAEVMAAAQDMADGVAFDADQEAEAIASGWTR